MKFSEDIESRFTGRHQACIKYSGNLKDKTILDIGCWIGWFEQRVIDKYALTVGIDLDREALARAKKDVNSNRCEFICASANYLPFKINAFNVIVIFDVIEHLPVNLEQDCLLEINRVLRKNGELLISTPNNSLISVLLDPAYFLIDHRHYSFHKINELLMSQGFNSIQVYYCGGIVEALSIPFLYLFKHLFHMEMPFKKSVDALREKEYQGTGFVTLFVKAVKVSA